MSRKKKKGRPSLNNTRPSAPRDATDLPVPSPSPSSSPSTPLDSISVDPDHVSIEIADGSISEAYVVDTDLKDIVHKDTDLADTDLTEAEVVATVDGEDEDGVTKTDLVYGIDYDAGSGVNGSNRFLGSIFGTDADRTRRMSVWFYLSGLILTIATLCSLVLSISDSSDSGWRVSKLSDRDSVSGVYHPMTKVSKGNARELYRGEYVKVDSVSGDVHVTKVSGLIDNVKRVLDSKKWSSGEGVKTSGYDRVFDVTLGKDNTDKGKFSLYVNYSTTRVLLKKGDAYWLLPGNLGAEIYTDLNKKTGVRD